MLDGLWSVSVWWGGSSMVAFSGQLRKKAARSDCCNASSICCITRNACWNARSSYWNARITCTCAWCVICFSQQFHYLCCCRFSSSCSRIHFCRSSHYLCFSNSLLVFQQLTSCVAAAVIFAAAINDCSLGVATAVITWRSIVTVATPSEQSLIAAAKITAAATQVVGCCNTSGLLKHK